MATPFVKAFNIQAQTFTGGGSLDKQLENYADLLSFLYQKLMMNP